MTTGRLLVAVHLGMALLGPNLVFGDPTKATAEKGQKALGILTAQWLEALRGFAGAPLRVTSAGQ
jgi:creatinine amidohydrolase/Fe(II)-dependent formamide hydrolase-like protein